MGGVLPPRYGPASFCDVSEHIWPSRHDGGSSRRWLHDGEPSVVQRRAGDSDQRRGEHFHEGRDTRRRHYGTAYGDDHERDADKQQGVCGEAISNAGGVELESKANVYGKG